MLIIAQPTLPGMTGTVERGIVLLSWTCQYNGVKSIAVLHSTDSTCNYSTVGYVRKLNKGPQAFLDGHPAAGKNFYKLSVVFNSGLIWNTTHFGIAADSAQVATYRYGPGNDALQKLIVNDNDDNNASSNKKFSDTRISDKDKGRFTEKLQTDSLDAYKEPPHPKLSMTAKEEKEEEIMPDIDPEKPESTHKITISTEDDASDVNADVQVASTKPETPARIAHKDTAIAQEAVKIAQLDTEKPKEPKKKINITFDDKEEVNAYIENLPKVQNRKITISFDADTLLDPNKYLASAIKKEGVKTTEKPSKRSNEKPKRVSISFNDAEAANAYMESLPKAENRKITLSYSADSNEVKAIKSIDAPVAKKTTPVIAEEHKPKISIKFPDEPINVNATNMVKSRFVSTDATTGHVNLEMPADVKAHHYSIKFYDTENHMVIEVPRITLPKIIMDKRNFQKKGQYKFVIRKDNLEFETGYITIY